MITSEEIKRRLWDGANNLRGTMDASRYKDYMLGLMFYKFLSDKTLQAFKETAALPNEANVLEEYRKAHQDYGKDLDNTVKQVLGGYIIKPEHLYQTWVEDIENGDFELSEVMDSLNAFERSITVTDDSADFKGLFSSSVIDLTNTALGNDLNKRSKNIRDLIGLFADLNLADLQNGDVLGDAYEYLIAQFASDSGKKAGEFYTPSQVSEVIAQIIARTTNISSIYDPTVGSGSLLLTVGKHLSYGQQKNLHYYGQEYITATYNLTRMNLLLHGVRPENMDIRNGNTMSTDWPEDPSRPGEGVQFDAVVMNPPYSDKNWNKHEEKPLKVSDPRFSEFGVLPPDSKGDFAYLMHGLYHLGQKGTMGIVLPHGVLFRGDTEGEIRKKLIDKNNIDAIIGLPSNLFTNTGIPVVILILKKNRSLDAPVLIVDASSDFIKVGKNNVLRERDIAKIVDTYVNKQEIENYSHLASLKEIKANNYNLNIPRYVNIDKEGIVQDVEGHLLGGIPQTDVNKLKVLQSTAPDIMETCFEEIRPGYVTIREPLNELKTQILNSNAVQTKIIGMLSDIHKYFAKYFDQLKSVTNSDAIMQLKKDMLEEIKSILANYQNVDQYAGYQIIATLWADFLENDLELISNKDFYGAGRSRKPNMVTKGQGNKKHEVQEGWVGKIVQNSLVKDLLFKNEIADIENQKSQVDEYQVQLDEIRDSLSEENGEFDVLNADNTEFNAKLVNDELNEAVKNVDLPEADALQEYIDFLESDPKPKKEEKIAFMQEHATINWNKIDKNKDGTVGKGKANSRIKQLQSNIEFEEGSYESKLVKVSEILDDKKQDENRIKEKEQKLEEAVYAKIPGLTDEEIDQLMYAKWFANLPEKFAELVREPINKELATLNELNNLYSVTLSDLDNDIEKLEGKLADMFNDLVVK